MTYHSRPVFELPLQWVAPAQTVAYDLKPLTMGFGAAEYAPTQRQVQRGWRFSFWLRGAQTIIDYETWSAALKGRLNGFWFPEPSVVMTAISSPAAGQVDVPECGLMDSWNLGVPLHVYVVDLAGAATAAAVSMVESPSAGIERITFGAAISPAIGWRIHRLLYVRQADDNETATNLGEHWEERELSVVELPEEYLTAETGDEASWYYEFELDPPGEDPRLWYYTSYERDVDVSADFPGHPNYLSLRINHSGITHSTDAQEETVKVETVLKEGTPWAEMIPLTPERPLRITISRNYPGFLAPVPLPFSIATVMFVGVLKEMEVEGRKVTMTFSSWLDGTGRIPKLLCCAVCPLELGDSRTCKVDLSTFEVDVTFDAISGMVLTVSGAGLVAQPVDYFARGRLDTGTGATRETRMILASSAVASGSCQVTVSRPLLHAELAGTATITPGCDLTTVDCAAKFDNLVNFGGYPYMPRDNPVLKGPEVDGSGGKK